MASKPIQRLIPPALIQASKVPLDTLVSGLTRTSDQVSPQGLYFAVRGYNVDGHRFVPQALERGAAAVVVEDKAAFEAHPRAVWVKCVRTALGVAAHYWYEEPSAAFKLVGITGTNGKTTCSFLLNSIWRTLGHRTGLVGTVEYRVGEQVFPSALTTPDALTLQALFHQMKQNEVGYCAMEVSSIALDQRRVMGSQFDVALFTNLTQDHLDYHGTMEAYYQAKARLFEGGTSRVAVLNLADPAGHRLKAAARGEVVTYATQDRQASFYVNSSLLEPSGLLAELHTPVGPLTVRSPLLGYHNLSNCLAVLAVQYALGEDLEKSALALAQAGGAPGRLERVASAPGRPYVFVDYAHTDDALKNVLESLNAVRGKGRGRLFTVFGCGGDRDPGKRSKMAAIAAKLSDVVVATSDNPRTEDPEAILDAIEAGFPPGTQYERQVDRRQAIVWALEQAGEGDFVLIAGKGHETYQILGTEKVPFDDRQVVRDYYG